MGDEALGRIGQSATTTGTGRWGNANIYKLASSMLSPAAISPTASSGRFAASAALATA